MRFFHSFSPILLPAERSERQRRRNNRADSQLTNRQETRHKETTYAPGAHEAMDGEEQQEENMRNSGIRCNELQKTCIADQNTIAYRFVNTDSTTPVRVCVSLGDTDPVTGKPIEDIRFFREYHKFSNRQAACNDKNIRVELTRKEKEERLNLRQHIAEEFEESNGYMPSEETLRYLLEEKWPLPYVMHIINDDDDSIDNDLDLADPSAEAAFPGNESDDTTALQEFARCLSGRLLDVYQAMLEKVDTGCEQPLLLSLAAKWNISPAQVTKDQEKIRKMIREYSRRVHRFSYDRR